MKSFLVLISSNLVDRISRCKTKPSRGWDVHCKANVGPSSAPSHLNTVQKGRQIWNDLSYSFHCWCLFGSWPLEVHICRVSPRSCSECLLTLHCPQIQPCTDLEYLVKQRQTTKRDGEMSSRSQRQMKKWIKESVNRSIDRQQTVRKTHTERHRQRQRHRDTKKDRQTDR